MLVELAEDVFMRQSGFCLSNTVVVRGPDGLLLIDPGVSGPDLDDLVDDLAALGRPVVAGFSTHPHWDHLIWDERFGDGPRYATPRGAQRAHDHVADSRAKAAPHVAAVALDHLDGVVALEADRVPWDGPSVRVIGHDAHVPGHAALVVDVPDGVFVAGDMLSDVEVPLLGDATADPIAEYRRGLDRLEPSARASRTLVPGHGFVAVGEEIARRFDVDRAYLDALARRRDPDDPRVGPDATYGRDWLPAEHRRQLDRAGVPTS